MCGFFSGGRKKPASSSACSKWTKRRISSSRGAGSPVSSLRPLDAEERREILHRWNDTQAPIPELATHEQIEQEAARHPERVAISSSSGTLTYGELDERSNRLARQLVEVGVGPERLVGIHLERSPEVHVALLAVLKSGGAFVPLDPTFAEQKKILHRCRGVFYLCAGGAEVRRFNRLLIEAGSIRGL